MRLNYLAVVQKLLQGLLREDSKDSSNLQDLQPFDLDEREDTEHRIRSCSV